jgi:hypothetical protein
MEEDSLLVSQQFLDNRREERVALVSTFDGAPKGLEHRFSSAEASNVSR